MGGGADHRPMCRDEILRKCLPTWRGLDEEEVFTYLERVRRGGRDPSGAFEPKSARQKSTIVQRAKVVEEGIKKSGGRSMRTLGWSIRRATSKVDK